MINRDHWNAIPALLSWRSARRPAGSLLFMAAAVAPLEAQSDYRNTDGGHPVRIEDALTGPRHSLDLELAPLRLDRLNGGFYRWQLEPRVSYGALPRTEFSLRAPLALREPGAVPRGGLVGVGVGLSHTLMIESPRLPALGMEGEFFVPSGGSLTTGKTFAVRALVTRTFGRTRVHTNVGYGTYRVLVPLPGATSAPPVPDAPCSVSGNTRANMFCAASVSAPTAAIFSVEQGGSRLLVGAAADYALALRSLLIAADVFAEHYDDQSRPVDWTAEVGVRKQLTPRALVEISTGRRFTGVSQGWFVAAGLAASASARLLIPETR